MWKHEALDYICSNIMRILRGMALRTVCLISQINCRKSFPGTWSRFVHLEYKPLERKVQIGAWADLGRQFLRTVFLNYESYRSSSPAPPKRIAYMHQNGTIIFSGQHNYLRVLLFHSMLFCIAFQYSFANNAFKRITLGLFTQFHYFHLCSPEGSQREPGK